MGMMHILLSTVMPLTLCSLFPAPFNMSSWKLNKNRAQGSAAGMDLDEPKEKRQRQDAGKKGGAKMKKLKEIKDLENLMPTIEVLTKANLNTMQNVRNLQSMTTVSIQISSSHKIVGLMKAAGKEYAAQARARGKQHGMGPPYAHIWEQMVECLLTDYDPETKPIAEQFRNLETQIMALHHHQQACSDDQEALLRQVAHCKVRDLYWKEGMKEEKKSMITLGPHCHQTSQNLIIAATKCLVKLAGGKQMLGQAAPSSLERQLQDLLG